ncbi:MAG: hypothetical protein U1E77_15210 [Inhella sp.]
MTFELEVALQQANKQELLDVVALEEADDMECIYVRQDPGPGSRARRAVRAAPDRQMTPSPCCWPMT